MTLAVWQYAALSEISYRRGASDQPLLLDEITSEFVCEDVGAHLEGRAMYADEGCEIRDSAALAAEWCALGAVGATGRRAKGTDQGDT